MNFYAVLGISRDADEETIRGAYRILARRYHPDRGAGSCVEKFHQVRQAYETLIDSGRRHAYDLSLQWAPRPVPSRQEDAGVFGRFEHVVFDGWFDSLDDLIFLH